MKKYILLLIVFFFTSGNLFAQRDTEHWFAPMSDKASSGTTQALYFSTDSVTPFTITIYNNNVSIGTVDVSKGNPAVFSVPKQYIITTAAADLFTPNSMGLYTKGLKPYFVTLRVYYSVHSEILTSKGKAGIGTEFYAVVAPITTTSTIYNFMTSVLATEDNTTVTVSGYSSGILFSNGVSASASPTLSFTLNKGQSYIIEGVGSTSGNQTGFIGAKIVASKPVSVTNGNMNGQFAITTSFVGSDIIMDQSVPTDRLGDEFVLVKGNGDIGQGMEGALIVATDSNTQVYINGNTTPVATLNAGEFYRANDDVYVNQGGSGHYNMYIKTSKKVYVYQLLAGLATSNATEGFNYIPPLNCYLPRKIDEIGNINIMPNNIAVANTKLNILTESGATVTVNGAALPATQGPFPVTGTANWVSYSVPNVSGNITVQSNKAVTAGICGGVSTAGWGGYFAGFSTIPVIAKQTGECISGIILEVDDSFDTYQWFLNTVAIPGATVNTFTPLTAGNYTCVVTVGSCLPVTTPIYKVFTCLKATTIVANACSTKIFTPTFSMTTTQTPVASTVAIVTAPTHGIATVNSTTGLVTYTPTPGYLGPDVFVYKFCGNAPEFIDCEQVTVNFTVIPFVVTDATIKACNYNGVGSFDLTAAAVTTSNPVVKKFYPTLADLNNGTNLISNPTAYTSAGGFAYVNVTTPENCTANAKITLSFYSSPVVQDGSLSSCFIEANPTTATFNLTTAIVTLQTPVTKKYYPTLTDANNGTNEITAPTTYISTTTTVYVRVFNTDGCYTIAKINLTVKLPTKSSVLVDKYICLEDTTSLNAGPGFQSYTWSTGATTQSISNVGVGEYWVILYTNGCPTKQIVKVIKSPTPVITNMDIANNTVTLTVSGGLAPYKYSLDTVTWQDSNTFNNLPRGQNTFYVKDSYDCDPISVEVTVPNLVNAITPNGDNINDYVDYSALAYKKDLTFSIYDRYGNKIYVADKSNNYRWDGKFADKKVYTGTYWYHVNWTEPNDAKTQVKYTGWILVKNIE